VTTVDSELLICGDASSKWFGRHLLTLTVFG
jgi:hypothetical protein